MAFSRDTPFTRTGASIRLSITRRCGNRLNSWNTIWARIRSCRICSRCWRWRWSWPSVALRRALFQALLEEREEDGQDPVHDRRAEQCLEAREVGRADGAGPPEQLLQRDERHERAVLDHRDELVADGR